MALLEVAHISFTYPQEKEPVLQEVSFSVEEGEMIVLCGATGCGKSTLLRLIKREISPLGNKSGRILIDGREMDDFGERESACLVGYVMQNPEHQIVTDRVWHEMAFGLENLGLAQQDIARRVAEMAAYFGIADWFDRPTASLSGGQKQLLNLAAVMVMQPKMLILDEPTAQLDPISASEFLATIGRLHREMGLTVIMAEHRLEEAIPLCNRLLVMERGRLIADAPPREAAAQLAGKKALLCAMPAAVRLFHALGAKGECPLDVREGRRFVREGYGNAIASLPPEEQKSERSAALAFERVSFCYSRQAQDVLRDLSFTVREGEICAILGANGSGKTTMLRAAAGLVRPYAGEVRVFGRRLREYRGGSLYQGCVAMLPQDVQSVFLCNTVQEELEEANAAAEMLPVDLSPLMQRHPYDLSGGEQQLVALCKVLAAGPKLLLMDEPTKGVDAAAKERLAGLMRTLQAQGMTIVVVTHDVEFAAQCADRCAMFFRGGIVSRGTPRTFFGGNSFYTTAVSRMTRGHYDGAVTVEDAVRLCALNGPKEGCA